jgi:hypothetical protein
VLELLVHAKVRDCFLVQEVIGNSSQLGEGHTELVSESRSMAATVVDAAICNPTPQRRGVTFFGHKDEKMRLSVIECDSAPDLSVAFEKSNLGVLRT